MTDEIWRPIPGWENFYSVSDRGRVRSEPRNVYRATTARGYTVRGRVAQAERHRQCQPVPSRCAAQHHMPSPRRLRLRWEVTAA